MICNKISGKIKTQREKRLFKKRGITKKYFDFIGIKNVLKKKVEEPAAYWRLIPHLANISGFVTVLVGIRDFT